MARVTAGTFQGMAQVQACESCGREEGDLAEVRRVYVRADTGREVAEAIADDDVAVVDDLEQWCFACRSSYPHQPAG